MTDCSLVPVDHQPEFDHSLMPVDHDPFGADAAAMSPETYVNPAADYLLRPYLRAATDAATGLYHTAQHPGQTLQRLGDAIGDAATSVATLPQRAIEASAEDALHSGEPGV